MSYALPSLLTRTDNWGAFIFFASWCLAALIYVYLLVPEIAGLSVEDIDRVFNGPWRVFGRKPRPHEEPSAIEGQNFDHKL
jgi:hypothetical protein